MKVKFVNFPQQYKLYKKEIDRAISKCLTEGKLILQEEVEKFEQEFAKFVGTKYAVGLNSGTDALYLALWAHGIGKGDEVLVPSHTFVATAQVVQQLGAKPVLFDLDGNINITEKTKAMIPAHITGSFGGDMNKFIALAKRYNLVLIEDACQALGAIQHGKMAGSFGHAGAFSFYPAKILGGLGDGGALVTNSKEVYEKVKELRNHCKGDTKNWGINSRLDNIQSAVLRVRLKHIKKTLARRKQIAEKYLKKITTVGLPENPPGRVWQDFIVRTPKRDELFDYLKKHGIETMKNEYPMPIGKLPHAERYEKQTLRIPCNEVLTDKEVNYVIEKIQTFK